MSTLRPTHALGGGSGGIAIFNDVAPSATSVFKENASARTAAKSANGGAKRKFGARIDPNALNGDRGARAFGKSISTNGPAKSAGLKPQKQAKTRRRGGLSAQDKAAALSGAWEVETCQRGAEWGAVAEFSDPLLDDVDGFLAGAGRVEAQRRKASADARLKASAGTPQKAAPDAEWGWDFGDGSDALLASTDALVSAVLNDSGILGFGDSAVGGDDGPIDLSDW